MASATMPMISPDGQSGEVPRAKVAEARKAGFKDATAMISPDGKMGYVPTDRMADAAAAGFRPYAPQTTKMETSAAPTVARAAMSALPAVGAIAGGALASPGIITGAAGAGLGAAGGEQARLLANRAFFGPEETSPISAKGLIGTGVQGASYAVPAAAAGAATRALLDQPMETGLRMAAPQYGESITPENLTAQREATRGEEEKLGAFMNRGYKPTIAAPSVTLPQGASLSSNPKPIAQARVVAPSESATTSTGPKVQFSAPKSKVAEMPEVEGIRGSVAKPSGRLILSPEEAAAQDQMQNIAKTRASQHGMMYAAGMRPAGGGRVPLTPTGVQTIPYPDPAEFRDLQLRIAAPDEEEELPSFRDRASD